MKQSVQLRTDTMLSFPQEATGLLNEVVNGIAGHDVVLGVIRAAAATILPLA